MIRPVYVSGGFDKTPMLGTCKGVQITYHSLKTNFLAKQQSEHVVAEGKTCSASLQGRRVSRCGLNVQKSCGKAPFGKGLNI